MAHARGDRVRLTPTVAQRLIKDKAKTHGNRGGLKSDWRKRCGIVISVSRATDAVAVLWDDRASVDYWPIRASEGLTLRGPPVRAATFRTAFDSAPRTPNPKVRRLGWQQ